MRRIHTIGCAVIGLVALTACDYEGATSLPLPGGVSRDDGYAITVLFDDATNLVRQETCRANDTIVGTLEAVDLTDDLKARVVCRIRHDVTLPANAVATIRETSLLGERYVSFDVPDGATPRGQIAADTVIPASATRFDPDTELVLSALSQVLNGGGLAHAETITRELTTAMSGSDTAGTIRDLNKAVGKMNRHRESWADTIDALDRLTTTLVRQRQVIAEALETVPGGLAVLNRQRPQLIETLRALSQMSRTVVPLIEQSRENIVADLKHITPVLRELTKAGDQLMATIERTLTYPFATTFLDYAKGDYGGMYATLTLDVDTLSALLGAPATQQPRAERNNTTAALPQLPLGPDAFQGDLGQPSGNVGSVPDDGGLPDLPGDLVGGTE